MAENDNPNPPTDDLEALRAKNAKLLQEAKDAKADATALRTQVEGLTIERDQATLKYQDATVNTPARGLLERIAMPGTTDVLEMMLKKAGYQFAMTEDGVNLVDAEGKVPEIYTRGQGEKGPKRAIKFTDEDITDLLCEGWKLSLKDASSQANAFACVIKGSSASGCGATGSSGRVSSPPSSPRAQQGPQFGLGMKPAKAA